MGLLARWLQFRRAGPQDSRGGLIWPEGKGCVEEGGRCALEASDKGDRC